MNENMKQPYMNLKLICVSYIKMDKELFFFLIACFSDLKLYYHIIVMLVLFLVL